MEYSHINLGVEVRLFGSEATKSQEVLPGFESESFALLQLAFYQLVGTLVLGIGNSGRVFVPLDFREDPLAEPLFGDVNAVKLYLSFYEPGVGIFVEDLAFFILDAEVIWVDESLAAHLPKNIKIFLILILALRLEPSYLVLLTYLILEVESCFHKCIQIKSGPGPEIDLNRLCRYLAPPVCLILSFK